MNPDSSNSAEDPLTDIAGHKSIQQCRQPRQKSFENHT